MNTNDIYSTWGTSRSTGGDSVETKVLRLADGTSKPVLVQIIRDHGSSHVNRVASKVLQTPVIQPYESPGRSRHKKGKR